MVIDQPACAADQVGAKLAPHARSIIFQLAEITLARQLGKEMPAAIAKLRHALRTLIKSGHAGALKALGHGPPKVTLSRFRR